MWLQEPIQEKMAAKGEGRGEIAFLCSKGEMQAELE
jgi:hypothetical protein